MPSLLERLIGGFLPELRGQIDELIIYQAFLRDWIIELQLKQEQIMATQTQFDERMSKIDAATTEIAADLKKLRDDLAAGGAVSDANLAVLDAKIAVLDAMGKEPETV